MHNMKKSALPQRHRLLMVLDTTHGEIGGTEQNSLRFAQALKTKGHHPIIVEVGKSILKNSADYLGLEIQNIDTAHFDTVPWQEWRQLIKRTQPSIILRSKTWIGCINWHLDIAAFCSGANYLSWEHHPAVDPMTANNEDQRRSLKKRLKNFVRTQLHFKTVDGTVTVSNAVREPLISFYPAQKKVSTIYPGVDFDAFQHRTSARAELLTKWNVPESAFVIGSLGRLVAHKGNDFTLQVLAKLIERNPALNVYCVLAGKGPDLARLQQLAEDLGIADRVRFPGWQEDAAKTWSAFDLFLMPSSDEGLGMTLIEAIACGCFTLGAAVGGMKEILNGALSPYCLPPEKLDEWIKAVESIIAMPTSTRVQQQQNIYRHARQKFDSISQWNSMVDWINTYR